MAYCPYCNEFQPSGTCRETARDGHRCGGSLCGTCGRCNREEKFHQEVSDAQASFASGAD